MNIREVYIKTFFKNLTEYEKEEIYFDNYMWHSFSYGKIKAQNGVEAIKKLREHVINNVYIIFQNTKKVISTNNVTYEQIYNNILENKTWQKDCYVIDKNFKWTFILTHETVDEELEQIYDKYGEIPKNTIATIENKSFYIGPFYKEISE